MNKKVLIPGGSGGLGVEIARIHLAMGDSVWVLDRSVSKRLQLLVENYAKLRFIECDLSKTESVRNAVEPLGSEIDNLDYIYNCTGIYKFADKATLPDTILDNAAEMYDINAVGFLRVIQAVFSAIQDGTVVICITSEAGSVSENWRDAEFNYCMSKAAENMACVILQKYYDNRGKNVRILCIHPGWMRTTMGGPGAFENPDQSVDPKESAQSIVAIAMDVENIPKEKMYMDYRRQALGW